MLIYSQDRKSVINARQLQVQRNLGGGKDAKYMILAYADGIGGNVIASTFPDEKTAVDALEKAYTAFAEGAKTYKFD